MVDGWWWWVDGGCCQCGCQCGPSGAPLTTTHWSDTHSLAVSCCCLGRLTLASNMHGDTAGHSISSITSCTPDTVTRIMQPQPLLIADPPGHQQAVLAGMNHRSILSIYGCLSWMERSYVVQDLGTAVARLILPCLAPTQQPHNSSPTTSILDVAANKLSCILHPLPESAGILPPYEHLELPNLDRDFCISYQFGGGRRQQP